MRATLRRTPNAGSVSRPPFTHEDLQIDFEKRQVKIGDQLLDLTPTEYDLLAHLVIHAGRLLTHSALLQAVWGPEYRSETEYLWAYIGRLRRKIEPDPRNPQYILTQPGVGYYFAGPT